MRNVILKEMAKQVVRQVAKTDEFGEMREAKDNLTKDKPAMDCLQQFHRDNDKMCNNRNELSEQDITDIKKRFEKMMQIPEMTAYFTAGQKLESMLTEFYGFIDSLVERALEEKG